jgi:uncharacterized protein YeaO (DUF488 family)
VGVEAGDAWLSWRNGKLLANAFAALSLQQILRGFIMIFAPLLREGAHFSFLADFLRNTRIRSLGGAAVKIQHLGTFVLVSIIVGSLALPVASFGQSPKRDDSLKIYTSCDLDDGLKIVQVDRLPKGVKSRTVSTSKGNQKISLADGFRVMVAYNDDRDWFANIKAEKSFTEDYERDKEGVIENLKWAASTTTDLEDPEPVKVSFNGREGYGTSKRTLTGNILGMYVLFSDSDREITTFYFINHNAKRKRFQTIEEWKAVRDRFLHTYTACINKALLR